MTCVDSALDYLSRGFGIVPLYGVDGDACRCRQGRTCPPKNRGKHPSLGNDWQKKALRSGADVVAWWEDHPHDNVGILTGPDSGIFVFDVDGAAGIRTVTDLASEHGGMPFTRIVRTGSGGLHYFFRHPGHFAVYNSASWIGPGIDIRGVNGQVVAPPSVSARGAYEVIADNPIVDAPEWLLTLLHEHSSHVEAGRSADTKSAERVDVEFLPPRIRDLASTIIGEDEGRYGHFYALVAECFDNGYSQGQAVTVVAPWCAAVNKYVGRVESEVARAWGKLQSRAAKAEEWLPGINDVGPKNENGILKLPAGALTLPADTVPYPAQVAVWSAETGGTEAAPVGDDEAPVELIPTWRPIDLSAILSGTYVPEKPTLFPRTDGAALLYPGRVHSFHGESESGKSLIIQAECARLIMAGEDVLYLDFESDASSVVGRMLDLGCTVEETGKHFTYVRPDNDPRRTMHERTEYAALLRNHYALVVIDGMTDALGAFGAGTKDNDEIASFMRSFPRLVATRTKAAVVIVDHVTKDADSRGRYALGGQAKMNALDGSAFTIEVTEALGRGMRGVVTMRVAKDRPGGVRPVCGPFRALDRTQEAARVVIDSEDGPIDVTVEPPMAAGETAPRVATDRPTTLMQRVSQYLEAAPEPLSGRDVTKGVPGHAQSVRKALTLLVTEEFASATKVGSAVLHSHVKPYHADEDDLSDTYSGWPEEAGASSASMVRPERVQNRVRGVRPPPPSPLGGGRTDHTLEDDENSASASTAVTIVEVDCTQCHRPTPSIVAQVYGGLCGRCAEKANL